MEFLYAVESYPLVLLLVGEFSPDLCVLLVLLPFKKECRLVDNGHRFYRIVFIAKWENVCKISGHICCPLNSMKSFSFHGVVFKTFALSLICAGYSLLGDSVTSSSCKLGLTDKKNCMKQ